MEVPGTKSITPMFAGDRLLTIRRAKMNKHKRRKRQRRDRFQLLKYHRQQKAKVLLIVSSFASGNCPFFTVIEKKGF